MKLISFKFSVMAIAISSAFATYAQETEFSVDVYNSQASTTNKQTVGSNIDGLSLSPEQRKAIEYILNESGKEGELSQSELDLIERKKHILFKHLAEQQELKELRELLEQDSRTNKMKNAKTSKFPYTPDEIRQFRELDQSVDHANNSPLNGPVEFKIKTVPIDVDAPRPIQILVAKGYSSSIMFFDQSGAPWEIEGDIIGDPGSFKSHVVAGKPHVGVFEIKREFSESNALVSLKGLDVPIVIRLTGSVSVVDARISVRIPKFGPDAKLSPYVHSELDNVSPDMLSVLNGDKLNDGKLFNLNGAPGTVWYKNNMLYIRTRADLISPPWKSHMTSATGYQVYEVPPVTQLLFTVDGEMTTATIEKGFDVKLRQKRSIFQD